MLVRRLFMASTFVKKLDIIAKPGTPPQKFIKDLGPLHASWHAAHNQSTADLGFLLFHWELIRRFKKVGADKFVGGSGGIKAFSTQELAAFNAHYSVNVPGTKGDVAALEQFSYDVEGWHNNAHMAIGMAVHKDLMNPKTNVRIPEFWRLHYFINQRFERQMKK